MIPANELRLGNIVHLFGRLHAVTREDFETWTFDDMQPVNLDEEVLKGLGFDNRPVAGQNVWSKPIGESSFLEYSPYEEEWTIVEGLESVHVVIWEQPKYLHQLQNLYFALAGVELKVTL